MRQLARYTIYGLLQKRNVGDMASRIFAHSRATPTKSVTWAVVLDGVIYFKFH